MSMSPNPTTSIITPIGSSFWKKLDGSIDVGFSYTRSSGVAQLNFNSDTIYRKPAFQGRLSASVTVTQTDEDSGRDDRGSIEISYLRYPWQHWFFGGGGRFETNESLGLELRSQIAAVVGPRLVNSNRAQMAIGAGVAANEERGVDVEPTGNFEALFMFGIFPYVAVLLLRGGEPRASIAGLVVAAFAIGGMVYSLSVRQLLRWLGQKNIMMAGGALSAIGLLIVAPGPSWPVQAFALPELTTMA